MNADVPAGSRPEVSKMTVSMGETAEVAALGGWTCDWPSPSRCTPPSGNGSAPRALLRDKVACGELGRKTGQGNGSMHLARLQTGESDVSVIVQGIAVTAAHRTTG